MEIRMCLISDLRNAYLHIVSLVVCFVVVESMGLRNNISTDNQTLPEYAVDYLKQDGYQTNHSSVANITKEDNLRIALLEFQECRDIPISDLFDNATKELMKLSHDDFPDEEEPDFKQEPTRFKRYSIGGTGWMKSRITYYIENYNKVLGRRYVSSKLKIAFKRWSQYSLLIFHEVFFAKKADIIVKFASGEHGDNYPFDGPGKIIAHAYYPYQDVYGGDIHFDDDENWSIKPSKDNGTDFFAAALHEIGHSIGLGHSKKKDAIMYPFYKWRPQNQLLLQYDDATGLFDLYAKFPRRKNKFRKNNKAVLNYSWVPTVNSTTEKKQIDKYRSDTDHEMNDVEIDDGIVQDIKDLPDICEGNYDSISVFGTDIFVFKGQYLWQYVRLGVLKKGYPVRINEFFHGILTNYSRITASYERYGGVIVLFTGDVFWLHNGVSFVGNNPRPLTDLGLPADLKEVSAAQEMPNHIYKSFLFSGNQVWRIHDQTGTVDKNYPRYTFSRKNQYLSFDATATWLNGTMYFFKKNFFWKFEPTTNETSLYPSTTSKTWFGCK